jgi:membrane protease YdiL (CAAX protease family)
MVIAIQPYFVNFVEKFHYSRHRLNMASKLISCVILVGAASMLLVSANSFLGALSLILHDNPFINSLVKYQVFALALALIVSGITLLFRPESKGLLRLGELSRNAEKESWLGISGVTTWQRNAAQLLVFISLATGIFMAFAVAGAGAHGNMHLWFIPWILLFSCVNALSEELIFRFAVLGTLTPFAPKPLVLLVSAVMFGLPHYNGFPSGIIGIIMAGVLGYVLSKASYETSGLGIALGMHIVQDIIIFTGIFMMKTA